MLGEAEETIFGFNPSLPLLGCAERAKKEAKQSYKGLIIQGNVERKFFYVTLLSTDLLPFGHLDFRLVVLPIEPLEDSYRIIEAEETWKRGFSNLANWLDTAQKEWDETE